MSDARAKRPPPYQAKSGSLSVLDVDLDDDLTPSQRAALDPWTYTMDTAPRDGSEVALLVARGRKDYKVCVWRKTRRVINYNWTTLEGWSDAISKQMLVAFEPAAWARYDIIDGVKKAT